MSRNVRGYSRVVNGRQVTVRAYVQPDETINAFAGITDRPPLAASRGVFTHGLVPSGVFPAGRDTPGQPPSPFQRASAAELHQVPLSASVVLDLLALSAAEDWTSAVSEALDFILTVVANNPQTEMPQILTRPDVQGALHDAGLEGAQAAIHAVSQTWAQEGGQPDSGYLHSILGDLDRNGQTFPHRMTQALAFEPHDRVERIVLRDRLRAAAAEATAAARARAEADLAIMRSNGVTHVRWVANYVDNTPCSACDALNGTVMPIGLEFDHTAGGLSTPVYQNLIAPPRHPNCKCRLVPVAGGSS